MSTGRVRRASAALSAGAGVSGGHGGYLLRAAGRDRFFCMRPRSAGGPPPMPGQLSAGLRRDAGSRTRECPQLSAALTEFTGLRSRGAGLHLQANRVVLEDLLTGFYSVYRL